MTENNLRPTALPHPMVCAACCRSPNILRMLLPRRQTACAPHVLLCKTCRSSPRPISIGQLNMLPCLHLRPINHVVYMGSYPLLVGYLIFGRVSRLDAFSVYLIRTWLPSRAIGMTTGAPEVRPSRSSRTKDSSHQISCAHDR